MASMRTLRRRLHRWRRYAAKTYWSRRAPLRPRGYDRDAVRPDGHLRAYEAVQREEERRFWDETPEIWLGGPAGEAALIADVLDDIRCCLAGEEGHPGPCVTTCSSCGGDGRCPDCGGVDDLGCGECDGSGSCPGCWGEGEHVEEYYIGRPVETVQTGGLL